MPGQLLLSKKDLERHENARRAIVASRKLVRNWQTMARVMSRNPHLKVELHAGATSCTDGKTVFIKVPMELSEDLKHDTSLCQHRDEWSTPLCHACSVLEDVNITVIHEVAHVIYGTFDDVTQHEKLQLLETAIRTEAQDRPESKRAAALKARIEGAPPEAKQNYWNMASLISPYLPFLMNACEDIRVNTLMQRERPGTQKMFQGQLIKVFRDGVLQYDGSRATWADAPPNAQAAIVVYCKVGGYKFDQYLDPDVLASLVDQELDEVCDKMRDARSVRDVYRLSFRLLEVLRRLGYMKAPDEPEDEPQTPPMNQEEDQTQPEEGNDDGDPTEQGEDQSPDSEGEGSVSDGDGGDSGGDSESPSDEPGEGNDADESEAEGESSSDGSDGDARGSDDEGSQSTSDDGSDDREPGEEPGQESGGSSGGGEGDADSSEEDRPGDGPQADNEGERGSDDSGDPRSDDGEDSSAGEGDDSDAGESGDDSEAGDGSPDRGSDDDADDGGSPEEGDSADQEGDPSGDGHDDGGDQGAQPGAGTPSPSSVASEGTEGDPATPDDTRQDAPGSPQEDGPDVGTGETPAAPETGDRDNGKDGAEASEPYTAEDQAKDGLPEDIETLFKIFGQHEMETSEPSEAIEEQLNEEAISVSLQQIDFFDSPSLKIDGVDEHLYQPDTSVLHDAWRGLRTRADIDVKVDEAVISGSLQQLRLVFQDNKRGKHEHNLHHGKVHARVLARRVPVGDGRVFQKKIQPGIKDYFVVIGVDCSGSTAEMITETMPRLALMKMAVAAKAEMLTRIGIPFAVYAHTGSHSRMDIFVIKNDREPWGRQQKEALSKLQPYSANLDGHTLEYYRKVAERRSETDRLILYYTDGAMPAANFKEELVILQREIKTCQDLGIHLVGIGVNSDSPTKHGLDTILLDDLSDVKKVVEGLRERLM